MEKWTGFKTDLWQQTIDVRNFIQQNYTPYSGDDAFLVNPTDRTTKLWQKCSELLTEERLNNGVLAIDAEKVSTITSHQPGYIDQSLETIFGLQTDAPLKRSLIVNGGIRMAEQAAQAYNYTVNPEISDIYHNHCTTHNTAVFNTYTEEMRQVRRVGLITGLPDAYGRGRIIGDYRRIALYGTEMLIENKKNDFAELNRQPMLDDLIRLREETAAQIAALHDMETMAKSYGFDISRPAETAMEAVQWLYFGYLAAIKEQNGAAMSLGRVSTFLDIYIERDLAAGVIDESEAQELIDQLVIKLRLARHLRTPDYNDLFAGDPLWITEAIGGIGLDGRHLVTRTSYRILHSLTNLGPAPEPNLTVLWSAGLPVNFKQYCTKMSITTSSLQYENDDLMRPIYGDDYAIACCVSAMEVGKQMQFFGARANLAKALLLAINGGRDEKTGEQVVPDIEMLEDGCLDYDKVRTNYSKVLDWLAGTYINTLNVIHYMHDKYAYEQAQMALHDTDVKRTMACGVAGLSVVADSLSAIKFARVKPIRDQRGIAVDFTVAGDFPCYGNDDDAVDSLAVEVTGEFNQKLKTHPTYRNAEHTLSILTITSNVMYGRKTGATPDGRKAGQAFAPGANPMHGRDKRGALAAMNSVSKLNYNNCRDGISYTFSIVPSALGKSTNGRATNLTALIDGYFAQSGHHININVLDREILIDAMDHPENYPQLTIRVSGYAVNFIKLTRPQQEEVLSRTFFRAV
ncbi:Formate acetyltransferase [bioreactor metagenome]|uniref:formate C-acetyltransferase n=1 Tax=bioreactor metagenome TaxID=1076179 RepID=A0A644W4G4_9ZZZZ|nr:formate C-acetyltransferase [Negativicutes bacterium]